MVGGDIALYDGPARPTGGARCVALLVGPNAPIALKSSRASYMRHVYDFCKPDRSKEAGVVDGQYSLECYIEALDACYRAYNSKDCSTTPIY